MSNTVPDGWKLQSLAHVAKFIMGQAPAGADCNKEGTGIPFVKAGEFTARYPVIREWTTAPHKLAKSGDVLICVVGATAGKLNLGIDCAIGRSVAAIRPEKTSTLYLYNFMQQHVERLRMGSSGSAQGVITTEHLKNIQAPFPPLPEQQKIAAILSSVDNVIEKTRSQIDKLKDLRTGMMQELLTKGIGSGGVPHTEFKDSPLGKIPVSWQTETMGEVFDFKNGVNKDKTAFGHGVPIISYKNVYVGGGIVDSNINALVEMNDQELERFRVNYGDVFFTRTSETPDEIGFTNVYLGSRNNVVFNGFVIRGRQKSNIFDPGFLKYVFQSNVVRKQMMDNSKFTTRAGISGESLGRIKLAIPNIPEQRAIASILDSIQNRINRVSNKLMAHKSLKKALMQDLLTGKVRVSQKESAVA